MSHFGDSSGESIAFPGGTDYAARVKYACCRTNRNGAGGFRRGHTLLRRARREDAAAFFASNEPIGRAAGWTPFIVARRMYTSQPER